MPTGFSFLVRRQMLETESDIVWEISVPRPAKIFYFLLFISLIENKQNFFWLDR